MRVPSRREVTSPAACSARTWAEVLPTGIPAAAASASTLRSAPMSRSSSCRRDGLPSALPTRANWASSAVLCSEGTRRILLFKCALDYLKLARGSGSLLWHPGGRAPGRRRAAPACRRWERRDDPDLATAPRGPGQQLLSGGGGRRAGLGGGPGP